MSQKLDREGTFRANPVQGTLSKKDDSKSVSWQALFKISEAWNAETKEWEDWSAYDLDFLGFHRLTKNDGNPMELNCKSLAEAIGWDGDVQKLCAPEFDTVQIVVKNETYNGTTSLRLAFINPADADPSTRGQIKAMDPENVKAISLEFNQKFKALVGKPKAPPALPPKK